MKKRVLSLILAAVLALALPPVSAQADQAYPGDVDGDGAVTLKDAAIVARHAAGWEGYTLPDGGITYPRSAAFSAGFGQADITPPNDIPMAGSGNTFRRLSIGVLDPLYVTAVALCDENGTVALFISLDVIGLNRELADPIRSAIADRLGMQRDAIFLTCTHTHNGPDCNTDDSRVAADVNRYLTLTLLPGILSAAKNAVKDLSPASISTAAGASNHINFVRRYYVKFKDGTYGWAGVNDGRATDISSWISHETEADNEIQLILFARDAGDDILMYNWQCHACCIGSGNYYQFSSDFINASRNQLETNLPGVRAVYYQGCSGNVTHSDNTPAYSTTSSYAYSQSLGRSLATSVEAAFANLYPVSGDTDIRVLRTDYLAPRNANQAEMAAVIEWNRTNNLCRELTEEEAMTLLYQHAGNVLSAYNSQYSNTTTVYKNAVAAAHTATGLYLERFHSNAIRSRCTVNCTMSNGTVTAIDKTKTLNYPIFTISVGDMLGFVGLPVELFDTLGKGIKHGTYLDADFNSYTGEKSPFELTFVCSYTNGRLGYMPAQYAYQHWCYEVCITPFAPGDGEAVAQLAVQALDSLYLQNAD